MYIYLSQVSHLSRQTSEWHLFLGKLYVIWHYLTNVGSRSLKEFPESAVMRPILLYAHLLQRLAYLHSRQTHLATESRHDVGSGEIYRFLVLAGLAITRRDEFARYIRRLISPVALVELRNLTSVKPIPESRVEKMTYLGIYPGIVDGGCPGIVDMIDFKDEPSAVAGVVGEELHIVARGAERRPVWQSHLAAAIDGTVLDEGLGGHCLELVHLLAPHTVNLLHVDEYVLGKGKGVVLGHALRVGLHTEILSKFGRQEIVHERRLVGALRTEQHEDLMIHHIVVECCRHHSHKPSAHIEVEVGRRTVAAVHHAEKVGYMVVSVPLG